MFEVIGAIIIAFAAGMITGYIIGSDSRNGWIKIQKIEGNTLTLSKPLDEATPTGAPVQAEDTISNEGVGIVMRPSAEELKKMNEDETTRLNKEATAETFGRVGEPRI